MVRRTIKKGFTLVEILIVVIILGILAAIVIPQFTNASQDARRSNMISQLQTLKSQIALYKLQHNDNPPTSAALFWTELTGTTTAARATPGVANDSYGPYFPEALKNPLVSAALASTVIDGSALAVGDAAAAGWVYTATTGEVRGVNENGRVANSDGR
ncbi:MAG TPA: prepilin-type N-terminal cleavage/methylation domain-containing protein [Tepidisphaeraceae bacterium]|nr:prepilin-type N-terminal cleavage/methylation domain-containing protein [Tepidisphaeraceae bacterium]